MTCQSCVACIDKDSTKSFLWTVFIMDFKLHESVEYSLYNYCFIIKRFSAKAIIPSTVMSRLSICVVISTCHSVYIIFIAEFDWYSFKDWSKQHAVLVVLIVELGCELFKYVYTLS